MGGSLAANNMLGKYIDNRMPFQTKEEKDCVKSLLHQTVMKPCSSEVAVTMILKFGAYAREPLINLLPNLQMKVAFLYGDQDWMDQDPADELLSFGHLKDGSSVVTVPQAGHNLIVDNPTFVAIHVYSQVFG